MVMIVHWILWGIFTVVYIDEVLKLPWIWGMDSLMKIFVDSEYTELFMTAEDGWKPVLK